MSEPLAFGSIFAKPPYVRKWAVNIPILAKRHVIDKRKAMETFRYGGIILTCTGKVILIDISFSVKYFGLAHYFIVRSVKSL